MNERTAHPLTISTHNLSNDCASVVRGENYPPVAVSEAAALDALRVFASLSAMALVDVEAKIYLAGPRGKVAVQNIRGRLYVTQVPEGVNTAEERTPEQTLEMVMRGVAGAPDGGGRDEQAAADAALTDAAVRQLSVRHRVMNSRWVAAVLLIGAGLAGYVTFSPTTPADVELLRDPTKIAAQHTKLNGRYGNASAMVLVLDSGKLAGVQGAATGSAEQRRFELGYRIGLRGEQVVLLAANGALLEVLPGGNLKFLESTYPRLAK